MHIHFVTGRLAERALHDVLEKLAPKVEFSYSVQTLNITVAALLTPAWIAPRLQVPASAEKIILPGYCAGDLTPLHAVTTLPIEIGPRDLRRLPEYFGQQRQPVTLDAYDIEIVAEINHAARLTDADFLAQAKALASDGADLIDIGCEPGTIWNTVGERVKILRDLGLRVSIDSMNVVEVSAAVKAGAELVLSVNSQNCHAAVDWGVEVVVVPDTPDQLDSMDRTIDYLANRKVRMRLDPILEPIGFGFAASLLRYHQTRQRYPDAELFMGIGNITELTDADSAGINLLLLAICQEWDIRSVLTTQVINWARNAVRECDLARRLVRYAVEEKTLAKHREPRLIPLRGQVPREYGAAGLDALAAELKDNNYRIFAERDALHLIWAGQHLQGTDPFALFAQLLATRPTNIDASHAFYLGYELAKANTALTLHKHYEQDEALDWGYLTRSETHARLPRSQRTQQGEQSANE
jgi:dihydropteroate synthase-like protein